MMSTTGDPAVGQPDREALASLAGPPPHTRPEVMESQVRAFRVVGSPGYELDEAAVAERAELVVIDGMGHNVPPGLWDELTSRIAELANRTERAGAGHTGP
jgi:hypothetical protein